MDLHPLRPTIIDLSDPRAVEPALAGAKAANLARAARAGLPVLPGFVVTTEATAGGDLAPAVRSAVRDAAHALGAERLVVRSSSTVEDAGTSSMAGQFTSVLGITDDAGLDRGLDRVLESGRRPHSGEGGRPMAVLVQPELDVVAGGVLFGIDPLTGDRRVCAVDAVRGSPERVVSGTAVATHVVLGRRGRVRRRQGPPLDDVLGRARRRELVGLAHRAARGFGAPQDVEWGVDREGRLWLLQTRPVTAVGEDVHGPLFGPGPLAETFPDGLAPLEAELWLDPLREALGAAVAVIGTVPQRRIDGSRVVALVGGRPAVDLELIGAAPLHHPRLRVLSPWRGGRRLVAAWRTGRLRAALPALTDDLLAAVDHELLELPALDGLDPTELLGVLEATRTDLRALHGYEILCGALLAPTGPTAAGIALGALAAARRSARSDEAIIASDPVVLALVAPRIGGRAALGAAGADGARHRVRELGPREALRLRCRWVQELGARAAEQLALRLALSGTLADPGRVRELSLASLGDAVAGVSAPLAATPFSPGPPLPVMFRLGAHGAAVAAAAPEGDGMAASSGRASGVVRHRGTPAVPGRRDVLVVDALVPELAAELEVVAAIVSETGSPLSHLAILARERSIPVAVGVEDARRRFPEGGVVVVDGDAGTVSVLEGSGR